MKNTVLSALALALAAGSLAWNLTHKAPKIGYAETSVLLAEFSEAIQARKQFEQAQKEWDANLKTLNDSLVADMDRLKAGFDKASAKEKDSMRTAFQKRNEDLQRYSAAVKKMAEEKDKELMDPVVKKVNSFLDLWGKQHGYDMIFGTMQGGNVLQANGTFNVTAAVLKDMNEHYKDSPAVKEASKTSASGSDSTVKDSTRQ